ncbi:MAG TPA: DUF2207 domain-containing protein [Pseudolysinimonas sp.]|nr:DUF2207 domain-containing protein [Pseudolysinimonas sp.]
MRMRNRILATLGMSAIALAVVAAPASAASASVHQASWAQTSSAQTSSAPAAGLPSRADDTSAFTFDSFHSDFVLSRDDEGRSLLHTTETLVARFPANQNRGIVRDIPTEYRGHLTQLHIVAVTDENGRDRDYETSFVSDGQGSYLELRIGVPEGQYAPEGANSYVIEYTQKDVTLDPDDSSADEFFWDVNGTGWAQPFGEVSATITLDPSLVDELNGDAACYFGVQGSTTQCEITKSPDGVFSASTANLGPYSNMSVALGFAPGAFAPARFDILAYVPLITFIGAGLTLLALLAAIIVRVTVLRNAAGRGIVVAQYEPAADVGMFLAANLVKTTKRGMGSAIVDLAVRRNIRIVERPATGFLASGSTFGVQYVSDAGLTAADHKVMSALFASGGLTALDADGDPTTTGGTVKWLSKSDTTLGRKVIALTKGAASESLSRGLRRKPPALPIVLVGLAALLGFLLLLGGGIAGESELGLIIGIFGSIVSAFIGVATIGLVAGRRPLTRAGAEAVEHLEGLREYIRLAEADRLRMLQSVTGAERTSADTAAGDGASIVKIYERLLPYAVLFGLEKEWAQELAKFYDANPPDWYDGGSFATFQVAAFAASVSSFSSTVSSSYSGSSSSSSSGGSSGGGSSGGGGGGGGGGGF